MIEPDKLPVESVRLVFGVASSSDMTIGTQSTGKDHAWPLVREAIHGA